MKIKKMIIGCLLACTSLIAVASCGKTDEDEKTKVGILQPLEHDALGKSREGFIKGLADEGFGEDKVEIVYKNALGDDASLVSMASNLVNTCDLALAIGTGATQKLVSARDNAGSNMPVLFTAVTDPVGAELVDSLDHPGVNVTGTSDMNPVKEQIELIKDILPTASKIGILYNSGEQNSQVQAAMAETAAINARLTVTKATVTSAADIAQITANLARNVDAIYIPTDNLLASNMSLVETAANDNNTLVVAGESGMVDNGAHVTLTIDYYELGVMTGKMAAKILKGEKASEMAVQSIDAAGCKYYANEDNLRAIGITYTYSK